MRILVSEIQGRWPELFSERLGPDSEVTGIAPVQTCGAGDLVFVDKPAFQADAQARGPACVVTSGKLAGAFAGQENTAVLVAENVGLAQALLRQGLSDRDLRPGHWPDIHPSAVIHQTASLGRGTVVGPCVVVEAGVTVGDGCVIMAGSVLEHGARLGERAVIHPNVTIGYGCELGDEVVVHSGSVIGGEGFGFAQDRTGRSHRIPQTGRVVLEDRVRVGACNCIDRAAYGETRIGAGTKLDNLCHIAHNVTTGQDCLLTAGLIVAGSTRLGSRVIASGSTGILDHLEICDDAVFVHRAGVIKNVTEPGVYAGTPIQPLADYTRNTAAAKKINDLRRQLQELEKKVAALEER
jgi:UDP-3-O-[3-hydroxymyristoyl] glucosamine N-acyltransferase